jgi:hypothetical protein
MKCGQLICLTLCSQLPDIVTRAKLVPEKPTLLTFPTFSQALAAESSMGGLIHGSDARRSRTNHRSSTNESGAGF